MTERNSAIGPDTPLRISEMVFNLLKPFGCLDIDHHAEETTVHVLRNSWNVLITKLKQTQPDAFRDDILIVDRMNEATIDCLRSLWPDEITLKHNERSVIIEFIIRSARSIGRRRVAFRRFNNAHLSQNREDFNRELRPRPVDYDALNIDENSSRSYLYKKLNSFLNVLEAFYRNTNQVNVIKDIPSEMPESFKKPERQQEQDTDRIVDTVVNLQISDEISEEDTCKICYTKKRTHGFVHAAQPNTTHFISCEDCAVQCDYAITGCPICRCAVICITKMLD